MAESFYPPRRTIQDGVRALTRVAESSVFSPQLRVSAVDVLAQLIPHVEALTALYHLAGASTLPEVKAAAAARLGGVG